MEIVSLRVQHTRNHTDASFHFPARVSVITGRNGSGKTTLLEALHTALRGASFRGSDSEVLGRDETWWRVDMRGSDDESRTVKFDSQKTSGRKQFDIDGKTISGPSPRDMYSYETKIENNTVLVSYKKVI